MPSGCWFSNIYNLQLPIYNLQCCLSKPFNLHPSPFTIYHSYVLRCAAPYVFWWMGIPIQITVRCTSNHQCRGIMFKFAESLNRWFVEFLNPWIFESLNFFESLNSWISSNFSNLHPSAVKFIISVTLARQNQPFCKSWTC